MKCLYPQCTEPEPRGLAAHCPAQSGLCRPAACPSHLYTACECTVRGRPDKTEHPADASGTGPPGGTCRYFGSALPQTAPPRGSPAALEQQFRVDRTSTRLNSSHVASSYAVFCLQ